MSATLQPKAPSRPRRTTPVHRALRPPRVHTADHAADVAAHSEHSEPTPPITPEGVAHDRLLKLALIVGAITLVGVAYGAMSGGKVAFARSLGGGLWQLLWWPAVVMGVTVVVSFLWRVALWLRYRPVPAVAVDADLPSVTVVIPAYNEGAMVARSILSAVASDYPRERLRVICVDDGSADDTWQHMERARRAHPDHVELVRFAANRGKRHALHAGMGRARSEIVVTLDSDSVLDRGALRSMVAPFGDPQTGAVAGCVKVYNRGANLLTRMLAVRYLLGFDFARAYQSELGTVFCVPGALAAYRRAAIAPHLDGWRDQRFLGRACTNGDDHALTNVVLRQGLTARYQSDAVVLTVVPDTWVRLSRMYVRWARSNVRESWRWMGFGLARARRRGDWLAWLDGVVHFVQIPARIWVGVLSVALWLAAPALLIRALAATTVVAGIYALITLRSERGTESVLGILYGWMALLTMQWIYPWAALTVHHNRWLTRARGDRPAAVASEAPAAPARERVVPV